jgi:putative peptide maturation system protein
MDKPSGRPSVSSSESLLQSAFRALLVLADAQLPPDEAISRFSDLLPAAQEMSPRLLWRYEPFDESYEYQAVVQVAGEGSTLVAWRPDDTGLPWPLRGVQRWNMNEVVRVDGQVMTIDHILACLDHVWHRHITQRVVDVALIEAEIQRRQIQVTPEELERSMADFQRRELTLSVLGMPGWLQERGMTQAGLERHIRGEAALKKLKAAIADGKHAEYFERYQSGLAQVTVARAIVSQMSVAEQLIDDGAENFYPVVESIAATGGAELLMERRRRDEFNTNEQEGLRSTYPGSTIGPFQSHAIYSVLRVIDVAPAEFDEATIQAVGERLFSAWLIERRNAAEVSWFWGKREANEGQLQ